MTYSLVPIERPDDPGATAIVTDDGEMVALREAPVDMLADFVDYLREQKQAIDAAIREITAEAIRRADVDNATKLHGDRWILTVDGDGTTTSYDGYLTFRALSELVSAGKLSVTARDEIVAASWKIDGRALARAMKRPVVAEAMADAIIETTPKARYLKLSRA